MSTERLEVVLTINATPLERRLKLVAEIMRALSEAQKFEEALIEMNRIVKRYEEALRGGDDAQ